jgi:hypothetical protein
MQELQLSLPLPAARELGRQGQQRALEAAERRDPEFGHRAYSWLADYVQQRGRGEAFTGESLVDAMKLCGITPKDDRAFGSIFSKALRLNLIRRHGFVPRRKGHGTQGGSLYVRGDA